MAEVEREGERVQGRGWAILILLAAAIVGWGLANYFLVPDVPRQWDFGALRDVPAQSIYSTSRPAAPPVAPRQMPALPEANTPGKPGG